MAIAYTKQQNKPRRGGNSSFPGLPDNNTQNVQFSTKNYKACKESVAHSQKKLTKTVSEEAQTLDLLDKHNVICLRYAQEAKGNNGQIAKRYQNDMLTNGEYQ